MTNKEQQLIDCVEELGLVSANLTVLSQAIGGQIMEMCILADALFFVSKVISELYGRMDKLV